MTDEGDPLEPPEWADAQSWRAGFATAMELISVTAGEHADLVGAPVDPTDEDPGDDECPDCGRDLVDAIGSEDSICPTCDV